MSNTNMIEKIAEQTGKSKEECQSVMTAFEKASENALVSKFRGVKRNRNDIIAEIMEVTNVDLETCETILDAFEATLDGGIKKKFGFSRK